MDKVYGSPIRDWLCALALSWLALAFFASPADAHGVLRPGARGPEVVLLQHYLFQLGHLNATPDGIFGPATRRALTQFQEAQGLAADGIAGARTWSELERALLGESALVHRVRPGETLWEIARIYGSSVEALAQLNRLDDPGLIRAGQELLVPFAPAFGAPRGVELVLWSEAQKLYGNFEVITVTDVRTGKSFRARRYYGHHHADSEPLTAEDTRILREIYGEWSWERRPILVEVAGRTIAASMNGFPHGGEAIAENDFPGHFCIHFLGSRIHRTGKIDPRHQAAVLEAAGYAVTRLWLASP